MKAQQTKIVDDAALLAKAVLRAASEMSISQAEVGAIIGRDRSGINRGIKLDSKSGELSLLFVRCYRSLRALLGDDKQNLAHWFATNNAHLNGVPKELVKSVQGLTDVVRYLDGMRGKI
jgi:Antitoxin Xre/MbcA/ParS C-terminal toxin-binding domain/Antitoxin Xre-like helix-turn-helix domain